LPVKIPCHSIFLIYAIHDSDRGLKGKAANLFAPGIPEFQGLLIDDSAKQ
jgi:hypothetical protein